ncbi:MAG TPA: amidohydrolase family protein [Ktedonosporobacter sp.]|nr:amidohydrolase family protein [Ktedonosporobacter sp.]
MATDRTLLQNGCVITVDNDLGNFRRADVLIEGTKIAAIGPDLGVSDAEIIDASQCIVMPGLIDTHRHLWEGILRNISADGILANYFPDVLGVLAPVYRPEDAYAGNLIGALGAIDAGVTTILDWSHIQNTPDHSDATIKGLQDAGIRAVFAYGNPNTSLADWWFNSSLTHPEDIKRLRPQYFASEDQLLTLALAPRGPEFTTMEVVRHDWALAREVGAPITVHVGVGDNGFSGGIKRMYEAGLLGPDTTYIHCCTLSDDELKYIVDTGGTFSIATAVEMQMRHGMPPLDRILRLGARPSLSVDVETNVPGDMFTQMRAALQCQRSLVNQRALYGGSIEGEQLVTVRDVLEFATINGARTVGLGHKTGSLTPGKEADIILLRADRLNVVPLNDPIGAVVVGADTGNVDSVFIGGKAMKRNGQLLNVDLDRARKLAVEARDYVVAKAGFTLPAF